MASYQYIFVMRDMTKAYPGGRKVLENVTLAFFPGAKIGVLGYNGAGKSTVLRIMAGIDKDFTGEAWAADGVTVGLLEQEPHLDPAKTVEENVLEGLAAQKALVDQFEAVSMKLGEVTIEPPRLRISGARSEVLRLSEVLTETIEVAGVSEPFEKKVRATPGGLHVWMDGENEVTVRIAITPAPEPEPEPPARPRSKGKT